MLPATMRMLTIKPMENNSKERNEIREYKRQAAEIAVDLLTDGMVVGLGSGTTASFAIQMIGEKLRRKHIKNIVGIPCSLQSEQLAKSLGIPLTNLKDHPKIDVTIDGADEVDPDLNMIKGGGGALLREKIVAQASMMEVIIVDETKFSPVLGTHFPLPIEVLPFGWTSQAKFVESLSAVWSLRKNPENTLFYTDQNNLIIDCHFGPIQNPDELAMQLSQRPGIIEHGLFIGLATEVIAAGKSGFQKMRT